MDSNEQPLCGYRGEHTSKHVKKYFKWNIDKLKCKNCHYYEISFDNVR